MFKPFVLFKDGEKIFVWFAVAKVVVITAMILSFLACSLGPGGWLEHLFGRH